MGRVVLHDKHEIAAFLSRNPGLHLYSFGDLDDFFWPQTLWYGWKNESALEALILVYLGQETPAVLAFSESPEPMCQLLESLQPCLPPRFYTHLSPGLQPVLEQTYTLTSHGIHSRMVLTQPEALASWASERVISLSTTDLPAIEALYQRAYPQNWFDRRMLETGQYRGIFQGAQLISIAGIHVYSPEWKVAALGNITTDPVFRGQGLGTLTTGSLCQDLLQTVALIGLNVKSDNAAAIRTYTKLGFEEIARYEEFEACFRS
ncbi:GNAT family N-acetyltransferase [bacterium (Candidatus Blackallbacteria) CG17_big_fil_post_rev_8_21_14_2_50_48_46]|uniref:GNAT family N-acetyltransferase n=1 Tax=bacterium (Candidatus Blackallbacteria) CG17_big_fil_post_rev_8_21_14_2_50_48_46 TaxID=2014261 RepID=A0A2M7G882_9BACT|nr:MAG: GNAT family N-acetyltransferase [bacterium (Candidatus Blackallbacteria) CG18_big_fil_WC_8_21_14_2_50_49_26]PIW18284.1 MAG: GNAT family N-acetyltransferase [bacterium (Candidatus Blackallbacteria) CG17_big_fil_post_rev_8_21_14_2_50_48_46]PIW49508.1 MAG: GNAT family N-acetyltransferase [bacterium (Candidatus Blackallbacteria) CG13_big_fil_rev_8_21_14_2_50_49_14]